MMNRGTVKPAENFNPKEDAEKLMVAVTGPGTDEDTVIMIITRRSNKQLQEVQEAFYSRYNMGCQWRLFDDFAEPIEWRMRMLISSRMKKLPERDAEYLHWALYGAGTDELGLIEVFGTRTRAELIAIYPYFDGKERLRSFLKDDIIESPFLTFLEYFMDPPVTEMDLAADVKYLREWSLDRLARLFASRDLQRMHDVFQAWEMGTHSTVESAVDKDADWRPHGHLFRNALLSCIAMAKDVHGYFAQRIYEAVHGPSTNDTQLIRVITSRCEVDMIKIKCRFNECYGMTLEAAVEDDTSGIYRTCLMNLITE